jgi:sporulation protein YlmC with PRC-barrel domain
MKGKGILTALAVVALGALLITPAFAGDWSQQRQGSQQQYWGPQGQQQYGQQTGMMPMAERASKIIDKDVKDVRGDDVGKVKDIVMSTRGRVEYIVLSQGGVLGGGSKLIPIPFHMARVDTQNDTVRLINLDKNSLQNAPSFTSDQWNEINQPSFFHQVHTYYSGGYQGGQYQGQQGYQGGQYQGRQGYQGGYQNR